jgi:hypothetical protein
LVGRSPDRPVFSYLSFVMTLFFFNRLVRHEYERRPSCFWKGEIICSWAVWSGWVRVSDFTRSTLLGFQLHYTMHELTTAPISPIGYRRIRRNSRQDVQGPHSKRQPHYSCQGDFHPCGTLLNKSYAGPFLSRLL